MILLVLGTAINPALGEEAPSQVSPKEAEAVTGPVNYDRAVRVALSRSPYFIRSSLEIEVKRLDEKDSKFDMIPPINFRTQYYVNRPKEIDSSTQPYVLSFASSNYNPIESYFTLQVRKMLTQIAVLTHMGVISDGIQKLGRMFMEMEALNQAAAQQQELVNLARENLDFFQNRLRIGSATSLEARVAAQEVEGAKAELERITTSKKRLQERIKVFIGLKPDQPLDLDCKETRRQVAGGFDPDAASLGQARSRSYLLKIGELRKELQSLNIMMAKARLLPSFFMSATTPDPLSAGTRSRDLFFSLGLEVPVWDGFKRYRNISRQKTILRQYSLETDERSSDLADRWSDAQDNLKAAAVALKAAKTYEELALLKERQSQIRYHSGGEPLPVYLEGRKGLVEAQRNTFMKNLDYNLAVLWLRHLSGDLSANYVDAKSVQE
jgi:outer membrane protein TolC